MSSRAMVQIPEELKTKVEELKETLGRNDLCGCRSKEKILGVWTELVL